MALTNWVPMTDEDVDWVNNPSKNPYKKSQQVNRGASAPLNTCMMKARISPDLISFHMVRRGDWHLKVSVYKNKYVMVAAHHIFDLHFFIKTFSDQSLAADFIEHLVE